MRNTLFLLFGIFLAISCTAQKPLLIRSLNLDERHTLVLLDSAEAARVLLQDETDRFFERVTASEMSIQMKKPLLEGQTRADLLPEFQDFLRRDVEDFTPDESLLAAEVMQEIFNTCGKVANGLFPDTLILIKTKGKHYGPSVYYTRENTIIIPEGVMIPGLRAEFKSTMYHELFHVYSRLNPEKRTQLYRLIGFEQVGVDKLLLPETLAERVLYNPDGVDFGQKIALKTPEGASIQAVPVIYANNPGFKAGRNMFFGYVEFNLFQIEPAGDGKWRVLTAADGYSSTLNLRELPDFFRQIRDNTGYIIHPDEVLADNFSFLMREQDNPDANAKFSEEGKRLLADMKAVLQQ